MADSNKQLERFEELKVIKAIDGLSEIELAELHRLSKHLRTDDLEDFERVAAAIDVKYTQQAIEPMSDSLRIKLQEQAANFEFQTPDMGEPTLAKRREKPVYRTTVIPWLAAAASFIFALFALYEPTDSPVKAISEIRNEFLLSASDIISVDWKSTEASSGEETSGQEIGDIVWSPSLQEGYMRFRNLPVNDPTKEQYQLWIFDKNQNEATPIDGGVFDIASTDQAIIPIVSKLVAKDVYLFAITIEKPGGVVVSSRERLPLIAQVN